MSNPLFVVEDGSGYANSTSYCTTDFANTYLAAYNESGWTSQSVNAQQGALMLATQSLDLLYGPDYYSIPMTSGALIQGLLFPRFTFVVNRIQVIQTGVMPTQLLRATAEVALMYINGVPITPNPNTLPFTKSQTQKLDVLEVQTTFGHPPKAEKFPGFWKVEQILKPLLRQDTNPSYLSL
jgi:hypothetical protein